MASLSSLQDIPHEDTNLIGRLYLRGIEKGRRVSRMLQHQRQLVLHQVLDSSPPAGDKEKGGEGVQGRGEANLAAVPSSSSRTVKHPPPPFTTVGRAPGGAGGRGVVYDTTGSMTCLVDVGDVTLESVTSSKYSEVRQVFQLLALMGQSYYPENMHQMIIVNGGFIFRTLLNIVKLWLDPVTQKKFVLISSTNHYSVEDIINDVDHVHLASPIRASSPSSPFFSGVLDFPADLPLGGHSPPPTTATAKELSSLLSDTSRPSPHFSSGEAPDHQEDAKETEEDLLSASVPSRSPSTTATSTTSRSRTPATVSPTAEGKSGPPPGFPTGILCMSSSSVMKDALVTAEIAQRVGCPRGFISSSSSSLGGASNGYSPLFCLHHTSSSIKKDKKHFDLFTALTKYFPPHCIPSWYGGELPMVHTPFHYAELLQVGTSHDLSSWINDAGNERRCTGEDGGAGVQSVTTVTASPTSADQRCPFTVSRNPEEDVQSVVRDLVAQLQRYLPVPSSSPEPYSSSASVHVTERCHTKEGEIPKMKEEPQESNGFRFPPVSSPSPLSFVSHHASFLASKKERQYWESMRTVMQHPRFTEALDAVRTLAPAEILPDTLLLPMLYFNSRHSHSPTPTSSWKEFCQTYFTGGGGNVPVGPVTDVESELLGAFLAFKYRK